MLKHVAHLRWRDRYRALRARLASVCCQCKSSPPSFFLSGVRVEGLSLANNRPEVFLQSNNFEMLHALAPKYGANVPVLSRTCSNPEEVEELPKVYPHSIASRSDPERAVLVSIGQVSRRILVGVDRNVVLARLEVAVLHKSAGERTQPIPRLCLSDANGLRASKLEHAVQSVDADGDFGRATPICSRAQRIADHAFDAADGCLDSLNTIDKSVWLPGPE
jgi:hypothetical protein